MASATKTRRAAWHRRAAPLALLCLAAGCRDNPDRPLQVAPETYRQMVAAFYTGAIGLRVRDKRDHRARLTRATKLVPGEPAAWANLALYHLRGPNYLAAKEPLERARALAPRSSRVAFLQAALARRQGRRDEELLHLRRAVALDDGNLRARYALVESLRRSSETAAEARTQLAEILRVRPGNVFVRLEMARYAAEAGDAVLLQQTLAPLRAEAPRWAPNAVAAFREALAAASGPDPADAIGPILTTDNLIKPHPSRRSGYQAVKAEENDVDDPLEEFLRLPTPRATAAPPDTELAFAAAPPAGSAAWVRMLPLAPAPTEDDPKKALPDGPPTRLRALSGSVALDGDRPVQLPFPGGTPSPDQVLVLDAENDDLPDLAFAGAAGFRYFRQAPRGRWVDTTPHAAHSAKILRGAYTGVWAIDVELDSDLDLVLGRTGSPPLILRNNGDRTWAVGHSLPDVSGLRDLAWADLDLDGEPDVAVLDGDGNPVLLENLRGGHYRRWPPPTGLDKTRALSVFDADRDGSLDLVVLSRDGTIRYSTRNPDTASWEIAPIASLNAPPAVGTYRLLWADLDNNGAGDLVLSSDAGTRVWLAGEREGWLLLPSSIPARVTSIWDLNGDGRLDLLGIDPAGRIVSFTNQGRRNYRSIVLRPRSDKRIVEKENERGNNKINSFGIGGEAELRAGLLTQKQPITGPVLHFGLGENTAANYARIIWPNGQPNAQFDLKSGQALMAVQRLDNSCPFLFAFDGQAVRFVTDILWKSPLGLKINAQETAGVSQTRDWVKLRGDRLRPRDGEYDLRITAELWETNFFDWVALQVVDHPAGTEVFIDERFSIPQPPLAVIATGPVRPVARAVDHRGRDVTDVVRTRDGRYLDGFTLGRYQGVAHDHWVEVELPEPRHGERRGAPGHPRASAPKATAWASGARWSSRERDRYLVAHGWVYPTDSSINVALSQGRHDPPRGLSIEVEDGRGGWRTVRTGLGFPAGKNKTVLLDLRGALPAGHRRLRLRTNLEVYWDAIGVADALPETRLRTRTIAPRSAELRYRGFSFIRRPGRSSPELPDYGEIAATGQQWLDLVGYYTRFGDVRELLARVDDRYVIMNAGDEIALQFPAPPSPPPGWARDFVFVSDGWDKDGNFNTTHSKTVLPLPSHDRPSYDTLPGRLEDDPVYRRHPRDWERFHTRYVTPRDFQRALWTR